MRRAIVVALGLLDACTCKKTDAPPTAFDRVTALASRFVETIAAGDPDRAHGLLCRDVAAWVPMDGFRRATAANPFLQRGARFDGHDSRTAHGASQVDGWLLTPAGNARATFYAAELDGAWCLLGALIAGTPLLPAFEAPLAERQEPDSDR